MTWFLGQSADCTVVCVCGTVASAMVTLWQSSILERHNVIIAVISLPPHPQSHTETVKAYVGCLYSNERECVRVSASLMPSLVRRDRLALQCTGAPRWLRSMCDGISDAQAPALFLRVCLYAAIAIQFVCITASVCVSFERTCMQRSHRRVGSTDGYTSIYRSMYVHIDTVSHRYTAPDTEAAIPCTPAPRQRGSPLFFMTNPHHNRTRRRIDRPRPHDRVGVRRIQAGSVAGSRHEGGGVHSAMLCSEESKSHKGCFWVTRTHSNKSLLAISMIACPPSTHIFHRTTAPPPTPNSPHTQTVGRSVVTRNRRGSSW